MELDQITACAADDLRAVDSFICSRLRSDIELINELANHIVTSGGKRLRPLLVLLTARAAGYAGDAHINLAAVVEFIHTATLLHDDVVDGSERRRGRKTANALWGNAASVLVGDFLYSRAFQMMVEVDQMRVMSVLADATNAIAEGEVLQLIHCNDPDATEAHYFSVIERKTAKLFEAAARLGAVIAERSEQEETALGRFGLYLGFAYQLIDDVLDYRADPNETGKNIGGDLDEGKPTLPLIYARDRSEPQIAQRLRRAIEQGGRENLDEVMTAIRETGALQHVRDLAYDYSSKATSELAFLEQSVHRESLNRLGQFVVGRTY